MTTHENTAGQYRRAPLNGLAIEAIVGAVWVLVFLGVYLKTHDDFTYINVALMCFVFPIIGWLTGLWERSACAYKTPTKQTRKIATIGAVMTTITLSLIHISEPTRPY